ncbi:MAG: 50S ribosomal protein L24 [Planctomycetes bacterium]|nr:50S ribosomal protein L24 [Planctomycetota bacterium]
MSRLKKGDNVIVIAGADRGKTGRVLRVDPKAGRVVVEGVNMKWKHVRKSQDNPQGGRTQREFPLQASNVAFLDAATGKGVRLGVKVQDGRRVRVMRPSGKPVEAA